MDYNRTAAVVAGLASEAAFHFGTGLDPSWPLAWLAPLPVLVIAVRASVTVTLGVALGAWVLGHLYLWMFLRGALRVPPPVVILVIAGPAVAFGLIVLVARALVRCRAPWSAALAVPAMWVTLEFVVARVSPHGTAGDLAYSQMDVLPVVQLASVTGLWGVTFLVMAVPAALAVVTCGGMASRPRWAMAIGVALIVAVVVTGGVWRLRRPAEGVPVTVGLAVSDAMMKRFNTTERPVALAVVEAYAGAVGDLAARGANVVVLPEKLVGVTESYRGDVERVLGEAAKRHRVTIVAGLNHIGTAPKHNIALVFDPDGTIAGPYVKHHLIPGIESGYAVGDTPLVVPATTPSWGVAICKDLDFPALGRRYAARGVGLMLVPAWDFVVDAWHHERMAAMRAVESGFALARSARQGLLTVRDDRGRLLAVTRSDAAPVATVAGTVKVRHDATVYARYGDWFAWLCVVATAAVLGRLVRGRVWTPAG